MKFEIKPKKVVVAGNELLMKPLSRREANEFRDRMQAAGEDTEAIERASVDLVASHVTFEDGSALDLDDVPNECIVEIFQKLVGVNPKSIADFTPTP